MIISVFFLFILIVFNGFFAGSEIAFISINENKFEIVAEKGNRKAELVLKLKEMPNRFLSTIQIGVSLASILSGVFAADAFANLLTEGVLLWMDWPIAPVKTFSMILITLITSYLMLVFGELVPKRLAMADPERFSFWAVYPLTALAFITKPIVKILSFSTNSTLKLLGINPESIKEAVTEEEIRKMVNDGEISPIEKEMIENIFKFDDMEVTEIMTHRTDVVAIDSKSTFDEILELVHQERFTRYPVYEEDIDNIIGVIHLRELLRFIQTGVQEDFIISDLLTKAYFVPDSKQADELFRELQLHQTHMGIVIDEYGGTAGIVTMENLIEEVMGEISDEYDKKKEAGIIQLDQDQYLVEGSCDLDDLEEKIEIGLPIKKYDTMNGFMIGRLGRIPNEKDIDDKNLSVVFNGYLFKVVAIDERMVSKVKVSKQKKVEELIINKE